MAEDQVRQFIEQATQSLQGGQIAQALELADQAALLSPKNAEAHMLRGVALSQSNQPQASSDAFRQALALEPANAKIHFNFAVHLYSRGQKVEALNEAQEAATHDPSHARARDLILKIETESGLRPPGEAPPMPATYPTRPAYGPEGPYQPGYEAAPVHTIKFVANIGINWTRAGWTLAVAHVGSMAALAVVTLPLVGPLGLLNAVQTAGGPLNAIVVLLSLASLVWLILDVSDRRGNFLWVIPQVLCGCAGCGFIVLPLYLLAGRK